MELIKFDTLSKVANAIGGEDAVKVVTALVKLGEVTDDQLLQMTEMKLNDIRKVLFKLQSHSIVQCNNFRDKDTGWFIFRWRLQYDQVEGFIQNQRKRILKILKSRLEYEEKNDFYFCNTPECRRITFDEAVEQIFRCPICGKAVQHSDNSAMIKVLTHKIELLESRKD